MRWLTFTAATSLLLLAIVAQVSGNAMFELELKSFLNTKGHDSDGRCCSGYSDSEGKCSEKCLTKFRVCLKVYQEVIDYRTPCDFGEVVTPILGENEIDFNSVQGFLNPVQFRLDAWQNTFSLIIEAWHDNNGTSSYAGPVLVHRLMTQRWLDVDTEWSANEERNEHSSLSYQYRVVCQEHYYGQGCRRWCHPRDDSFGHYVCNAQGDVQCLPGWQGADKYCISAICSAGCNTTHGSCNRPNECSCHSGWQGPNCDECSVYPGCAHGTCDKPWDCNCNEGWGGLFCNADLNYCANNQPCKNGATCLNTKPGSYSCQCPTGFRGTNCEVTNHTCATDPCQNGGTCLDTGNDKFVCQCPAGFNGQYCHITGKTCSDRPCLNDAICRDTKSGFQCHCRPGFEGETCQIATNECDANPCLNGGSCVDEHAGYNCVCPVGFTGSKCETNIDDCSHKPCLNNGVCMDGIGLFKCHCPTGYTGHLCESAVDICSAMPCANGGTCLGSANNFICRCKPGWGGTHCLDRVEHVSACASSPCQNGGACSEAPELSLQYRCTCPSHMIGPQCTVPITASYAAQDAAAAAASGDKTLDMATSQIVLIVIISLSIPAVAAACITSIYCMKKRRRTDKKKQDEEARRQNEQNIIHNAVNNKCLESNMIFNSLDYPVKPINTESQYNQIASVHYPSKQQYLDGGQDMKQQQQQQQYQVQDCNQYNVHDGKLQQPQLHAHQQYDSSKKAIENAYSIVPARSTKTLNTDSRLSLASRLEKDLDAACSRGSPVDELGSHNTTSSNNSYCKTPDPPIYGHNYSSHHTVNSVCSGSSSSGSGSTSSSAVLHHQQQQQQQQHQQQQHAPPPDLLHNNSSNTLSSTCSPSTCTTPSSIYVIEEHYDDTYIATQV